MVQMFLEENKVFIEAIEGIEEIDEQKAQVNEPQQETLNKKKRKLDDINPTPPPPPKKVKSNDFCSMS